MFGNKKKQNEAVESTKPVEETVVADFDDAPAEMPEKPEEVASTEEEAPVEEQESDISVDVVEVDEDLSALGFIFDAENDIAIVNDADFDTLVDSDGMFTVKVEETNAKGKVVTKKKKVKARRGRKRSDNFIGLLREENYGELLPFVKDINITDINWNGFQLWVDDIKKGRYLVEDVKLSNDFIEAFSIRVSNVVSKPFNKYNSTLEAETEDLRITILHESASRTGRAISIRKTPAVKRINFAESIRNGSYCSPEVANIMSNSVKGKMNIVVVGLPGVGKTELVKFLTNYIFPYDRVITVEDTLEIHYKDINPGKDCLELKVNGDLFSYSEAIKVSLRLLPQWILLSEARSKEVKYLVESVSTGAKCMTTLHTDDVRKIPDRIVNMVGETEDKESMLNSVYAFFDIGILIGKKHNKDTGGIDRWVEQICFFDRTDGKNSIVMLVEHGKLTGNKFSDELMGRFKVAGIEDPFKYTFI